METTLDGIRDIKLYQRAKGYRFSVDALLLYSFVNVRYVRDAVDLGAGSGVIGLLLAGKYPSARVLLVELQQTLYRLAERNIELNGLGDRVSAVLRDISSLHEGYPAMSYDLAVSNPPFRKPASGRLSQAEERAVARHEIKLRLPELAKAASHLLRSRGRFFMIFHPERAVEMIDSLRAERLEPKRIRFVHNDIDSVSKIVLVEAVKGGKAGLKVERPMILYNKDGSYTDEVKAIYGKK